MNRSVAHHGKWNKLTVVLFAADTTSPSVLYGLNDVLYSVGAVFDDLTIGVPGPGSLDVRIVTADGRPFKLLSSIYIEPHASIDEVGHVDAVVICDMYSSINQPPTGAYPEVSAWLRRLHGEGALVASVCSGSLVLAQSGLLDGREAATHWAYPKVRIKKDAVVCMT